MSSCASPLPLQLRYPPPHQSCSCYAVLRRFGSASPPPTYSHGNTINNLAMGSSKPAPSRTSVSPVKTRRSARHVEVTTPATEEADSQLTEAFPGVAGASTTIMPGKQRLGVYLRGVCNLELLAPDLDVGRN
ncbi:hypothetical protein VPH35_087541 [Triticum aestivum]|uniref:Uncharacterized protein n=1 Tax=Triticum aestivum TaxID=4565 RepID=B6Z277_WHEAT|nr:hypothetical protein [Triticum aestivum]